MTNPESVYVSEVKGSDESGDGSATKPYKTIAQAMRVHGEPFPPIFVDGKEDGTWEAASKAQLKKARTLWQQQTRKSADQAKKEVEDAERRDKLLEEAKKITISEDKALPASKLIKIRETVATRGVRVKLYGWVHRLRRQGKNLMFIILRDGTGFLQCVFSNNLCQTYNALMLSTESSIVVYGVINALPAGKTAPDDHELVGDYWELIGHAPAGGIDNVLNEEAAVDTLFDNRHLMIRGEHTSKILKMTSVAMQAFREHYFAHGYTEVY
jgi:asparaginyl-tRNA synthetase